jgi:hypothetical protein
VQTVIGFARPAGQSISVPCVLPKAAGWVHSRGCIEDIDESDAVVITRVDPLLIGLVEWWTIPELCEIFSQLSSRIGVEGSRARAGMVEL